MNLKYQFYKGYYGRVDFRKGEKYDEIYASDVITDEDKKRRKKMSDEIEEYNINRFKSSNNTLFDYQPDETNLSLLNLHNRGLGNFYQFPLTTAYPGLLIGSGSQHETNTKEELKLGFFFDHTTGLPLLPGSSVKGVLRSAFPQFIGQKNKSIVPDTDNANDKQKAKAKFIAGLLPSFKEFQNDDSKMYQVVHQLELAVFEGVDILKTQNDANEKKHQISMSKRCRFLDASILTTNPEGKIVGKDALTPHGDNPLRNPIPLPFLKVLPQVVFNFQFIIPQSFEMEGDISIDQNELIGLFKNILLILGIGAKTNVGYGQFVEPSKPVVYEIGQEMEGKLIDIDRQKNRLFFKIKGIDGEFNPQVSKRKMGSFIIGDTYFLVIKKLNEDGGIKFIQPKI